MNRLVSVSTGELLFGEKRVNDPLTMSLNTSAGSGRKPQRCGSEHTALIDCFLCAGSINKLSNLEEGRGAQQESLMAVSG